MRAPPPELPGATVSASPVDRGLSLLLAGELEAALRWSAAAVEQEAAPASALILTCRLLSQLGRNEVAIEGFELGVRRAIDAGSLPLAVAAIGDLRKMGVDTARHLDAVADAFCKDSPRLSEKQTNPPPLPQSSTIQPLSPYLSGPALLSKATEIIRWASQRFEASDSTTDVDPLLSPVPLFSALDRESLRALVSCFSMVTVPAGSYVIREGEAGSEAYIVARGELEVRRVPPESEDEGPVSAIRLARLANGALFGEMALLSRAPRAASVVALQPSILLVTSREALEVVAAERPQVASELAAHCRRRMVANLVRTSAVLRSVDRHERGPLVERFETRVFNKGEYLIQAGAPVEGLHLIASGEVAVVANHADGSLLVATLGAGDTAGEVALVLRRNASADVVAAHPTVSLFLPRQDFLTLVRDHPLILHALYLLAVRRDEETSSVLQDDSPAEEVADEEFVLV